MYIRGASKVSSQKDETISKAFDTQVLVDKESLVPQKIAKVRQLCYVAPRDAESELDVFWVDKGPTGIRLVYNGSSCGLNQILWAPWFSLPTIVSHLRYVASGTYMGDIDIGDCWHNFELHKSVQRLVGLNFHQYPFDMAQLRPLYNLLDNTSVCNKWGDHVRKAQGECFTRQCMGT